MVLAMTMFTLSYPDCTQAAEQPLPLAVLAEGLVFADNAAEPVSTTAACARHAAEAGTAIDPQHDLPDLNLAPDRTPRLGCGAAHTLVARLEGPSHSAPMRPFLRPPDLA